MKDVADDVKDDFELVLVTDTVSDPLDFEEEDSAGVQTCDYCGHYPCGCGG